MNKEETIDDLKRSNDAMLQQILDAINILDGNMEPIDYRDGTQPELLRKLCEHLEHFETRSNNAITKQHEQSEPMLAVVDALRDTHRHIEALYESTKNRSEGIGLDQAYIRAEHLVKRLCRASYAGLYIPNKENT